MTTKQTILAGWGLALGAAAMACVAFPAIAQKAAAQRSDAHWQQRATALDAAGDMRAPTEQGLARKLAHQILEWQMLDSSATVLARDQSMLSATAPINLEVLTRAQTAVQSHQCLSEAVYYEARSESRTGQKAVAEVIINRVKSKHYPNSICGVVYQGAERSTGCQFSFACDGSSALTPKGKAWERSQDVATLTVVGGVTSLTGGATHYHNLNVMPVWSDTLKLTKTIGTHKFYRTKWRERPVVAVLAVAPPSP